MHWFRRVWKYFSCHLFITNFFIKSKRWFINIWPHRHVTLRCRGMCHTKQKNAQCCTDIFHETNLCWHCTQLNSSFYEISVTRDFVRVYLNEVEKKKSFWRRMPPRPINAHDLIIATKCCLSENVRTKSDILDVPSAYVKSGISC